MTTKEFTLETGTPEAVRETELHRAEKDWQRRSDEVAARIKMPDAPYRIRGDTKEGGWFVEEAKIERSEKPAPDYLSRYMMPFFGRPTKAMLAAYEEQENEEARKLIALYAADRPKAKLVWKSMAVDTDEDDEKSDASFRTYAEALKWLREELEPVRDESVYFTADGRERT